MFTLVCDLSMSFNPVFYLCVALKSRLLIEDTLGLKLIATLLGASFLLLNDGRKEKSCFVTAELSRCLFIILPRRESWGISSSVFSRFSARKLLQLPSILALLSLSMLRRSLKLLPTDGLKRFLRIELDWAF